MNGSKIKSRLWMVVGMACVFLLALLFAGCGATPPPGNNMNNQITDNTVTDVNSGGGSAQSGGMLATGGSQSSSGGVSTATPSAGYSLSYWTRTKDGVTTKYASDIAVTETSGATYTAVFVADSAVVTVSTAAELSSAMSGNNNIILANDINATSGFTAPATFSGVLDGAGHKITVSKSSSDSAVGGLCNTLTGVIKNVILHGKVEGVGSSTTQLVGAFAATINGGLISRCENHAVISSGAGIAGGIVAQGAGNARSSTIYYCKNAGAVTAGKVGVIVFTNGTDSSPYVNLVNNQNSGAVQSNTVTS